ncbi:hypothetical protein H8959_013796 [Pygathrix nigripes]
MGRYRCQDRARVPSPWACFPLRDLRVQAAPSGSWTGDHREAPGPKIEGFGQLFSLGPKPGRVSAAQNQSRQELTFWKALRLPVHLVSESLDAHMHRDGGSSSFSELLLLPTGSPGAACLDSRPWRRCQAPGPQLPSGDLGVMVPNCSGPVEAQGSFSRILASGHCHPSPQEAQLWSVLAAAAAHQAGHLRLSLHSEEWTYLPGPIPLPTPVLPSSRHQGSALPHRRYCTPMVPSPRGLRIPTERNAAANLGLAVLYDPFPTLELKCAKRAPWQHQGVSTVPCAGIMGMCQGFREPLVQTAESPDGRKTPAFGLDQKARYMNKGVLVTGETEEEGVSYRCLAWCVSVGAGREWVALMTLTLFPVRLLVAATMMLLAWPLALVASLGSAEKEPEQPLALWRKVVDFLLKAIMRTMWFAGGFHRVAVKGRQALPTEAAILTLAPHSSYFDAIPVTMTMSSIVMKAESRDIPIWGTLIRYIRPVFVSRSDQDSRRKTVEEIKRRARSNGKWPQIMIFPEGTCTNRTCLITFKPGAFIPGAPVQPVVLRYPNKLDTITWTWQGPGALEILWLTLCQFHNQVEIEFLPVYSPSEEEKRNPALYASNVRRVMAEVPFPQNLSLQPSPPTWIYPHLDASLVLPLAKLCPVELEPPLHQAAARPELQEPPGSHIHLSPLARTLRLLLQQIRAWLGTCLSREPRGEHSHGRASRLCLALTFRSLCSHSADTLQIQLGGPFPHIPVLSLPERVPEGPWASPVTDYTFEDCQLALAEGQLRLPADTCLLEFARLVRGLGLKPEKLEKDLDKYSESARMKGGEKMGIAEFAASLEVPVSDLLEDMFSLFDESGSGQVDLRECVVALSVVCRPARTLDTIQLAFKMYGAQEDGSVGEGDLSCILKTALGVAELTVTDLFRAIDQEEKGKITFADFHRFAEMYPDFAEEYLYPDQTHFESCAETPPALIPNGFCADFSPENSDAGRKPVRKKLD